MRIHFFLFTLFLLAILALLFYGTDDDRQKDTILVVDVQRVVDNPSSYQGRELRVRGFVKPGSILRYSDKANFILQQEGRQMQIHFDGSAQLPDTFQDNAPVRADGKLNSEQVLLSHRIEAKCTSKYELPSEQAALSNQLPSTQKRGQYGSTEQQKSAPPFAVEKVTSPSPERP